VAPSGRGPVGRGGSDVERGARVLAGATEGEPCDSGLNTASISESSNAELPMLPLGEGFAVLVGAG
jgi:hypothetical protein